jgi:hypothetical protein
MRDRPEPREARVTLRVRLPRSMADRLNAQAASIANPVLPPSAARDDLIERALERLPATRCNQPHGDPDA